MYSIANILQEVSSNHMVSLFGRVEGAYARHPIMVEMNLFFALIRLHISMEEYPKWGDLILIESWLKDEGKIFARRGWTITNAETGKFLGAASSNWVTVNSVTRKLAKMPQELRDQFELFQPRENRLAMPSFQANQKLPNFEDTPHCKSPIQVARRADIDMNGHLNNTTYISWTLESVPKQVFRDNQLMEFIIDFKNECQPGEKVECTSSLLNNQEEDIQLPCSNGNGHMYSYDDEIDEKYFRNIIKLSENGHNGKHDNGNGNGYVGNAHQYSYEYLHSIKKMDNNSEIIRAKTLW